MLSVCMIAKNEARCIADAVLSVKPVADEIIVVDTGSTDGTAEIARGLGAVVIPYVWRDDFSHARNFSVEHAGGDWVLFLDADEVISLIDAKKIPCLCASSVPVAGYMITQRNYTNDTRRVGFVPCSGDYREDLGSAGFVPVDRIGIFRRDPRIRFTGIIHETVAQSIREIGGVLGATDIVAHHYGHLDMAVREKKTDYYLELGLRQIELTPESPKPYYDVGIIYLNRGDFISAQKYLLKTFELDSEYIDISLNLALLYFKWLKFDEALRYAEHADKQGTHSPAVLLLKGVIYDALGHFDTACSIFQQGMELYSDNMAFSENMALLAMKTNDLTTAQKIFLDILRRDPACQNAFAGLIQIYYTEGRYEQAARLIDIRESEGYYDFGLTVWKLILHARTGRIDLLPAGIDRLTAQGYTGGELQYLRAVVAQERGDIGSAVGLFSTALRLCPYLADEIKSRVASISLRR